MKTPMRLAILAGAILLNSVVGIALADNNQGQNNNNQGENNNNQGGGGSLPEIDIGAGGSAIAVLVGSVLLVSERFKARRQR